MNINYDDSFDEFNPSIKEEVSKRIASVIHLFPKWSQNLVVFYERENPEQRVLGCSSDYYYRFIQLHIYPPFLHDPHWEMALLHEIQHAILAPYTTKIHSIIAKFVSNEQLSSYLTEELADEEEAVVQDLAHFADKLCKSA